MSIPFVICFIFMLGFQSISLPALHKQMHEDHRWGFYFTKFVAMPTWFACTFAGALGILPGLGLILLSVFVAFAGMIIVMFFLLQRNPEIATILNDKDKDNIFRQKYMNYFSIVWGGLLLFGTLGAIAM